MNFKISTLNKNGYQYTLLETDNANYIVRTYFDADPDDSGISVYNEKMKLLGQLSGFSLHTQEDCDNDDDAKANMQELISAIENEGW